jgi:hypothetical protein
MGHGKFAQAAKTIKNNSTKRTKERGNRKERQASSQLLLDGGASIKLNIGDYSNGIVDWTIPRSCLVYVSS